MNNWKQKGGSQGRSRYIIIILFCLSVIMVVIISFLIAAQLILFPPKNNPTTGETTNIALQHKTKTEPDDDAGMALTRDPFLPYDEGSQNYDGVQPLYETGLEDPVPALVDSKLKSGAGLTPVSKKRNDAKVSLVKNKLKTNVGRASLIPTPTSDNKPKQTINPTGNEFAFSDKDNQDPDNPPQEVKESIVFPTITINNESALTGESLSKTTYIVKKNETVNNIAGKFGVFPESICQENGLTSSSGELTEGKTLTIPIPASHLYPLKLKETLWRLAQRYGTTVELLKEINNINDITKIKEGELIILPVAADKVVNKKY